MVLSLIQPIFPIFCLGFLQSVTLNSVSRILYYVLGFVVAPYFCASFDRCLAPMQVSMGMRYFGDTFIGVVSFDALLSLCDNNISFWVTFTLGFSLEILTYFLWWIFLSIGIIYIWSYDVTFQVCGCGTESIYLISRHRNLAYWSPFLFSVYLSLEVTGFVFL